MRSKYESVLENLMDKFPNSQNIMMNLFTKFLNGEIKDVVMICNSGHTHNVGVDAMKYVNAAKQGKQITCPLCDCMINNVKLLLKDNSLVDIEDYINKIS